MKVKLTAVGMRALSTAALARGKKLSHSSIAEMLDTSRATVARLMAGGAITHTALQEAVIRIVGNDGVEIVET